MNNWKVFGNEAVVDKLINCPGIYLEGLWRSKKVLFRTADDPVEIQTENLRIKLEDVAYIQPSWLHFVTCRVVRMTIMTGCISDDWFYLYFGYKLS
jgi:hypothetical protein